MQIITHKVGEIVLRELASASEVRLAVAYFSPDEPTLAALQRVPRLTLIVSDEFTINDPHKIESLLKTATVRWVDPGCDDGKLHAKVAVIRRGDGSRWAILGSANVTWAGFRKNREVCVAIEEPGEIDTLEGWFDSVLKRSSPFDLDEAKRVFESRYLYRLERRQRIEPEVQYWALKTTSGSDGEEHWHNFVSEGVLAIGWEGISVDPSAAADQEVEESLKATGYDDDPSRATKKIRRFVNLQPGARVLVCRGYIAKQDKPVYIHGLARVVGPFTDDRATRWRWRFKQPAVIQVIEEFLPKDVLARALGKESLRETIHDLNKEGWDRLVDVLRSEGVVVEI